MVSELLADLHQGFSVHLLPILERHDLRGAPFLRGTVALLVRAVARLQSEEKYFARILYLPCFAFFSVYISGP